MQRHGSMRPGPSLRTVWTFPVCLLPWLPGRVDPSWSGGADWGRRSLPLARASRTYLRLPGRGRSRTVAALGAAARRGITRADWPVPDHLSAISGRPDRVGSAPSAGSTSLERARTRAPQAAGNRSVGAVLKRRRPATWAVIIRRARRGLGEATVKSRTQWASLEAVVATAGLPVALGAVRTGHRHATHLRAAAAQALAVGDRHRGLDGRARASVAPLAGGAGTAAAMLQAGVRRAEPAFTSLADRAPGAARPIGLTALPRRARLTLRTRDARARRADGRGPGRGGQAVAITGAGDTRPILADRRRVCATAAITGAGAIGLTNVAIAAAGVPGLGGINDAGAERVWRRLANEALPARGGAVTRTAVNGLAAGLLAADRAALARANPGSGLRCAGRVAVAL